MKATLVLVLAALGGLLLLSACSDESEDLPSDTSTRASTSVPATLTTTPSMSPGMQTPSPRPSPSAITSWKTHNDPAGFSIPLAEGLVRSEQTVNLPAKGKYPAVQETLISFTNADGEGVVGVAITPNPPGLTVEEWVRTYPGWPTEPTTTKVAGEDALRFSMNVLGEADDFLFFQHAGYMFELSGGVYASGEAGYGATITKTDFERIIAEFRFD